MFQSMPLKQYIDLLCIIYNLYIQARLLHALLKLFFECSRLVSASIIIIQEYFWFILLSLYLSATSSCATQITLKVYIHIIP
jgi:hypothetical protein